MFVRRLSARGGCFRPIFGSDLGEFRAELVRTTLGAALRRRPRAAPRARALSPLRNYRLTGPSLSHLSPPRTPQRSGPQASRLVLATEFGAYRGRRNIIDQFHPNWKPRRYSPEFRVTSTRGGGLPITSRMALRYTPIDPESSPSKRRETLCPNPIATTVPLLVHHFC